ncbi:hypothetical protein [Cellulosimicrobium cellulans]|uniref:hypothetical protein n=1 Tax=Cellulosimicrobium cellulans TaxID=1710 RepID=UPI0011130029|nr:hypothetical protein [Cellulosimicrobium cellulans]
MEGIAWDEIGRLHALGYPVCDVVWAFASPGKGRHVGCAYEHFHDEDPRPFIVLEPNLDMWPDQLDTAVRSLVRHEFGHALIYMAGIDEAQVGTMFDSALDLEPEGNRAHEAAAEAISHLLTPEGVPRWWCYDKYIVPKNQDAAERILDDARE